jgi:hypothetical protein
MGDLGMSNARIALMGGMGFPLTETTWGMPQLRTRLEAIGATVILVSWNSREQVYNFLNGFKGFRGLCGDSLGAGSAAQYAGDLDGDNKAGHMVDFVGGFQPSMDDKRQSNGYITVPGNVTRAHCIYDPYWLDTMGLGQAQYIITHNSATKLLVTQHRGAHPDDWGYSQTIMFNEIRDLIGVANAAH